MPKKLQIKLLSQSAELLNVTNCAAGMVSVLRSESPSELRPYQRALGGTPGKERFVIQVDGVEYRSGEHNLIGFGEAPPHLGLSVLEYLTKTGLTESAINSLLLSKGLEGAVSKQCSALSSDEERRIRIIAASMEPDKALILNEPFEPISSQWREDTAEFLIEFVRSKNGLVVVAGLSYRPDAWIENASVARLQVGQSLRRTVGFGSAGSESMGLINQLRDQVRNESASQVPAEPPPPSTTEKVVQGASLAAAALGSMAASPTETGAIPKKAARMRSNDGRPFALSPMAKIGGTLVGAGLGVYAAILIVPYIRAALTRQVMQAPSAQKEEARQESVAQAGAHTANTQKQIPVAVPPVAQKVALVIDGYPAVIRASLIEASRGILSDGVDQGGRAPSAEASPPRPAKESGNLFKLLESASSEKVDPPSREPEWRPQDAPQDEPAIEDEESARDSSSEERRREAIRQKFLEAIQAAAEHRQNGVE